MFLGNADYSTVFNFDTANVGVDAQCSRQARMPLVTPPMNAIAQNKRCSQHPLNTSYTSGLTGGWYVLVQRAKFETGQFGLLHGLQGLVGRDDGLQAADWVFDIGIEQNLPDRYTVTGQYVSAGIQLLNPA
jgi:hypothetical protein